MKTKLFALLIVVAIVCLPFRALAYERDFPAGSILIPMDDFYQPEADGEGWRHTDWPTTC